MLDLKVVYSLLLRQDKECKGIPQKQEQLLGDGCDENSRTFSVSSMAM